MVEFSFCIKNEFTVTYSYVNIDIEKRAITVIPVYIYKLRNIEMIPEYKLELRELTKTCIYRKLLIFWLPPSYIGVKVFHFLPTDC